MGINAHFNCDVSRTALHDIIRFQSRPDTQNARPDTADGMADADPVCLTKEAAALQKEKDQPLSDAQLEYLYDIYLQLGDEDEFYSRIGDLVGDMAGEERTDFLVTLAGAGDDLKGMVLKTESLEQEDRAVFLKTAARLAPGDDLGNLLKAVGKTSGTTRSGFLFMADQLNRSARSIRADELENFIAAAAGSPTAVSDLTAQTLGFENEEELRENFLAAAALSGKDLNDLIAVTERLDQSELTTFLSTAANAGQGISMLISLSDTLNHGKHLAMLETASMLDESDLENFFLATQGEENTLSRLCDVTNELSGQNQSRFLSAAARAEESLPELLTIVPALDGPLGELDQFLSAAQKTGDNLSKFVFMVQSTSGADRTAALCLAAGLSVPDLASFITAARKNDAGTVAKAAAGFSGKDQSWFLYAASRTPDASELISQLDQLYENEKSDLLFSAANTDLDTESGSGGLLDKLSRMDDAERTGFLAAERARIYAETQGDAEYVYLKSEFDQKTIDAMLGADARINDILDKVDGMDGDQREAFKAIASMAGKELIPDLLDITDKLGKEDVKEFMAVAGTLNNKNMADYIETAQAVLDGTDRGSSRLKRVSDLAGQMSGAVRENFLHGAAAAGSALDGFMDITEQLGGMQRTNFLIAADNIADDPDGTRLLSDFIQGTQNLMSVSKESFLQTAARLDKNAGAILLDDTIAGASASRLTDYLKSAVWITDPGIDDTHTAQWVKSYLALA